MLKKTWTFVCNSCKCGIEDFTDFTKKEAIATARRKNIIFRKDKHYCDMACLKQEVNCGNN